MASLKRQFTELLSDIGFVKEGLRARDIEKRWTRGGDGVLDATGEEVTGVMGSWLVLISMLPFILIFCFGGRGGLPLDRAVHFVPLVLSK